MAINQADRENKHENKDKSKNKDNYKNKMFTAVWKDWDLEYL